MECGLNDNSDRVWLAGPALDLGSPAKIDKAKDIARAVLQYRWASQDDARRFLGWIVAAMVGGALEWRPHLWLTSPAGAGKTWLFDNVLLKLMGNAMMPLADATPAGVARFTGNSSLPIGIDEAEPSHEWVTGLLPTLRVASSGAGARVRADAHGGVSVLAQPLFGHPVQHHRPEPGEGGRHADNGGGAVYRKRGGLARRCGGTS